MLYACACLSPLKVSRSFAWPAEKPAALRIFGRQGFLTSKRAVKGPTIGVTGNFLGSADLPGFIFRDFYNGGHDYLEVYEGVTNERKHNKKDLGLKVEDTK